MWMWLATSKAHWLDDKDSKCSHISYYKNLVNLCITIYNNGQMYEIFEMKWWRKLIRYIHIQNKTQQYNERSWKPSDNNLSICGEMIHKAISCAVSEETCKLIHRL